MLSLPRLSRLLLSGCLAFAAGASLHGAETPPGDWDLAAEFQMASAVFYGKVSKMVPEPRFRTGVLGARIDSIRPEGFQLEEVVWPEARAYSFDVLERFRGPAAASPTAYWVRPDWKVWPQVQNEAGDVFLAQPKPPAPSLTRLEPGDTALFYVRTFLGSDIPVLHAARFGQEADDDREVLRAFLASGGESIEAISQRIARQRAAAAREEKLRVAQFEDAYYEILLIDSLETRRQRFEALLAEMGYDQLWDYQQFREAWLRQHGALLDDPARVPSGPEGGREKVWMDVSHQLQKIALVMEARARQPGPPKN